MQKIFTLIILLITFIIPLSTFATTEVYIYPVATSQFSYQAGDTIKGQFTIHNVRPERQSGIYYEIGVGLGTDYSETTLVDKIKFDPLYLEANSKRIIPFEYKIPSDIVGRALVVVQVYTPDKRLVAFEDAPISVQKGFAVGEQERLFPIDGYIVSSERGRVDISTENRLYPEEQTSFELVFDSAKSSHAVYATIEYRHISTGQIVRSEEEKIEVSETKQTILNIPTPAFELAGSYEATISFESDTAPIAPVVFNYYLVGPTLVFTNVNLNHLTLKKNQKFDLLVKYLPPTTYSQDEFEEVKSELEGSIIKVEVQNEVGENIFSGQQQLVSEGSTEILFKGRATHPAQSTKVSVQALSKDGKVFAEYVIELPSEEQVRAWYSLEEFTSWMWLLIGFVFLSVLGYLYRKYKKYVKEINTPILPLVLMFICLSFVMFPIPMDAYTIESGTATDGTAGRTGFGEPVFFSPQPSTVRSYDPGEKFDLLGSIRAFGNVTLGAYINTYSQNYLNDVWSTTNIPLPELFNTLDQFDPSNPLYCTKPYTMLLYWFKCEGTQVFGLMGNYGSTWVGSYVETYPWSNTKVLRQSVDWLGTGLFNNSEYLIPSEEFEVDIKSFFSFSMLGGGITRAVNHDEPEPAGYTGSMPQGWLFMMHTYRCTWIDGYPRSWCGNRFLHWKYFFPNQPFVSAYLSNESTIKSHYQIDLPVINEAKRIIVKYSLPGYELVQNFNFSDINTHYASNFNSVEFNNAINVILKFTYALSSSLHSITQDQERSVESQTRLNPSGYAFLSQPFDIQQKNKFKAPATPGFHKIYFYAHMSQRPPWWEPTWLNDDREQLVSQTICVRGAGVCPDETPIICPNLTMEGSPVYTQDENGVIYADDMSTLYVIDANGDCVIDMCSNIDEIQETVPEGYVEEAGICEVAGSDMCNNIDGIQSSVPDGYTQQPDGSCTFDTACTVSPVETYYNNATTYTATPSDGTTYTWSGSASVLNSVSTSNTKTVTLPAVGSYTAQVDITKDGITKSQTCNTATVKCDNSHSESELEFACTEGYETRWTCGLYGWETYELPCGDLARVSEFTFDPYIIPTNENSCGLTLEATNAFACTLTSSSGTVINLPADSNYSISLSRSKSPAVPAGRYTLSCTNSQNENPKDFGIRSCLSSIETREN